MQNRTLQPESCRPSRAQAWRRLILRPVNFIMHRIARQHLAQGLPQPAVFAFEHIGIQINLYGRYELLELEAVQQFLLGTDYAGGVMLDIGANIGNHSLFFARYYDHVIAFEPHPRTFQLLSANAQLLPNITAQHVGLSDHDGAAELQFNPGNMGGATLSNVGAAQKIQIALRRLDGMDDIKNLPIRLIKLDAEGHEVKLLDGGADTIRQHHPVILFELNAEAFDRGTPELVSKLQQLGYMRFAVLERGSQRLGPVLGGISDLIFGLGYRLRFCDLPPRGNHHMVLALPPG